MKYFTIYFFAFLFVFTGCAVHTDIHFYDGPRLEEDKIGVVKIKFASWRHSLTRVDSIGYHVEDGDSMDVGETKKLYLLPGPHNFSVHFWPENLEDNTYSSENYWYLRSEVLLSAIIEAGHKYVLREESAGSMMSAVLSQTVPFIEDCTYEGSKKIVSQITESRYDLCQEKITGRGKIAGIISETYVTYENIYTDITNVNIKEFNRAINSIWLLTFDVPYEGLPPALKKSTKIKHWYSEGDIVKMGFSHVSRYRKIWPHSVRSALEVSGYDIFIQTPRGGWYCWSWDKYVNKL